MKNSKPNKRPNKNKSLIHQIILYREAAQVRRCHTLPHHGTHTLADHCFGLITLLLLLHPKPTVELIRKAAFHDHHERYLGDMPAPNKTLNEKLSEGLNEAEEQVNRLFGIMPSPGDPAKEEQRWITGVDRLDLWLWCHEEEALGNKNVQPMKQVLREWFTKWKSVLPSPIMQVFRHYRWERTFDNLNEMDLQQ